MSDVAKQLGALGFNKEGQLVLPGFPEGFAQGVSLEAWVRLRRGRSRGRILEFSGGGKEREALFLGLGEEPGSLVLGMDGVDDREGRVQVVAPGALPEGRWVHVSATLDAQGLVALYVQGVLAASGLLRPLAALDFSTCYAGQGAKERGFDGELSQLRLWRRVLDPETVSTRWHALLHGDEPGLAAWYPLDAVSDGQVLDHGPAKRHARAHGPVECQASPELADAMGDVPLAARLSGTASLHLPPLTPEHFQKGLTIQAWIRPQRAGLPVPLMELGGGLGKERLLLRGAEGSDALVIEAWTRHQGLVPKGGYDPEQGPPLQLERICEVPGVLAAGRWTHVSAVLDPERKRCTVSVNGRVVHEAPMATAFFASKQVCTHCYVGRGSDEGGATFAGALAEVRLWRLPLPPQELAKSWHSRLRGDERELLACYRLDGLEKGLAIDVSSRRMHARVWGAVQVAKAEGLPLRSVTREGQPAVAVQGKLLTDHLPLSAFPSDRMLEGVSAPKGTKGVSFQTINAKASGTVQGSLVRSSVYEVIIEPRNAAGEPVGGRQVELSFDDRCEVLRSEAGKVWIESWLGGSRRQVAVPDNGRLRLCVLAGNKLDCPPVRVRCEGMAPDAWVVARPADSAQEGLLALNGAELRQPKQHGKTPVLDPDTKADDADAVADLLRSTAQALPLTPKDSGVAIPMPATGSGGLQRSASLKLNLGPVKDVGKDMWRKVESGVEDAMDYAERTVKHASDLLVESAEAVEDLVKKAANSTLQVGAQAARQCIRGAKRLAIDTGASLQGGGEAVWGVVQLVGTTMVKGSEKAFRVMVSGVTEVIEAIEEIARKVGAAIGKIIDYLAMLFRWDRFLANAERIYKVGLKVMGETEKHFPSLKGLRSMLDELMNAPLNSSLAKKTLGQALGLSKRPSMPGYDELNYLIDQVDSAFSTLDISFGHSPKGSKRKDNPAEGLVSVGGSCVAALPSELFVPADQLLSIPMKPLLALPSEIWSLVSPVCDPVLKWIEEESSHALKSAQSLLTSRLSVPVLTDLIETVVLGGKELNLLRLTALLGSIPMTLGASVREASKKKKKAQGSTALPSSKSAAVAGPAPKASEEDEEEPDKEDDDLAWLQFSISLVNSLLIGARAVCEEARGEGWIEKAMKGLLGASSALAVTMGSLDIYVANKKLKGKPKAFAITHGALGLGAGIWLFILALAWKPEQNTMGLQDLVVEILLGVGELTATIAAVSTGAAEQEELDVIAFRGGNWLLRSVQKLFDGADNNLGGPGPQATAEEVEAQRKRMLYAKIGSVSTCGLMALLDISEGLYLTYEAATGD